MEQSSANLDAAIERLARRLRDRRAAPDHWEGHLASSALSTATAILALEISARNGFPSADRLRTHAKAGMAWLVAHQNPDGGWGDTARSGTNISTTSICWAALAVLAERDSTPAAAVSRAGAWLTRTAGSTSPEALRVAILERYGKDRTFSVPILTVLALAGKLGADRGRGWRLVPQLPFELAAFPHRWFQYLQLPVVSYALPALIAIGQVRHALAPTRNPVTRTLRNGVRTHTHAVLRRMQPESGGYLEATPLTSFVVMSLSGMRRTDSPVVEHGIRFLLDSMRDDGSWPIDTNLATWVTTLSVGALADADGLADDNAAAIRQWLIGQQSASEHPFTHAAPGALAWTPLSGGVPDADDTAGALIALRRLGNSSSADVEAAAAGARWLLGLQNRDGGIPTFCRGWGTLPFDRSTPELTAHALRAWDAWHDRFAPDLQRSIESASRRTVEYLAASQRADGSWIPLWFGNERAPGEDNPVYGTARTLAGLQAALVRNDPRARNSRTRGVAWLLDAQNQDGGWGGAAGIPSSIEETGVALAAVGHELQAADGRVHDALVRGASWLASAVDVDEIDAAPVGLYFARLWYYEDLYPLVFALAGLAAARMALASSPAQTVASA